MSVDTNTTDYYAVTINKDVYGPFTFQGGWDKLAELEESGTVGEGDVLVARALSPERAVAKVAPLFGWRK
jgi:hypothetical protein